MEPRHHELELDELVDEADEVDDDLWPGETDSAEEDDELEDDDD
jgi:hypothetical protein